MTKKKTERRMLKSDETAEKTFIVFEKCWYRKVTKAEYRFEEKNCKCESWWSDWCNDEMFQHNDDELQSKKKIAKRFL